MPASHHPSTTAAPRYCPLPSHSVRWHGVALAVLLGGVMAAPVVSAQSVRCHLTYAGASRSFTVPPAMCPDEVAPVLEGASFVFKVTNLVQPARKAGVDIEVFTRDRQDQLQPTHKAHYLAWEASTSQPGVPHGFTGQQTVRGIGYTQGLNYWCERLLDKPAVQRPCGADTPSTHALEPATESAVEASPVADVLATTPAVPPLSETSTPAAPPEEPIEPASASQPPVTAEITETPEQVLPFRFISPAGGVLVPVTPPLD